jgi:hypothetical protein
MRCVTMKEDAGAYDGAEKAMEGSWPRFMIHGYHKHGRYWQQMCEYYPEYQFALFDGEVSCGVGNSIPLHLSDPARLPSGWGAAIKKGALGHGRRDRNNTLCAISASISPAHKGKRLSREITSRMKRLARKSGFSQLIAPVRPSLKSRYPLTPFSRYVEWKNAEGEPFDPWLRTHWRSGAKFGPISMRSMHYYGSIADWESWTGLSFKESGRYVVEGALTPVRIDVEADMGTYIEPNLWMTYDL